MKAIDIRPYDVTLKVRDEQGAIVDKAVPYDIASSMVEVLFSRDQQLNGIELVRRDDIAQRVVKAQDRKAETLFLENADYKVLRGAVETVKGLSRNDIEFVRRILDATDVEPQGEV